MAGRVISDSSSTLSMLLMRDQMPAMGQRSSPVSTKVRTRRRERFAGTISAILFVRLDVEKKVFMGFSFLHDGADEC